MKKNITTQPISKEKAQKLETIRQFLLDNSDGIQKLATKQHKLFVGGKNFKSENLEKYQKFHNDIIHELADNLYAKNFKKGISIFNKIGESFAKEAVQDGLTIEETVDGTIFLKQAIWKKLADEDGLLKLTTTEYHELNLIVGTYCDILASKLAFTYHEQSQYIESNLRYLAEASKILSSSLDYQTTLNTIAHLAVPKIGDWCTVDILEKNKIKQVSVAHKDPKKIKWAKELRKNRPIDMDAPTGLPNILRTGKSELYAHISDEMLKASSKVKKDYELMKSLGFKSAMIVPLFSQKKPIGAITFVTTETTRHYNQADLLMAEELATRASVAIENARLYKGSQEAITLRDDFISVASHELKTPVTSVKMFTQVLKRHSEQIGDMKAVSHLTKMDRQINKLTELIYDLLNVAKIQAGRMEFRQQLFDFDKAVKEVVDVLQQSSDKHELIIEGRTGKKVYGDEERIGQVVNNLVSNAIKYSPKAIKVVINLSSDKKNVQVSVQDFGIGMSKEHFELIFERFYRVYDNNDKTFPGLGIGLYISSEIVKRHGGKFWVNSVQNQGSIFSFSIPIDSRKKIT